MIRLSKRILFSIKAVLDIACHCGESSSVRSIDITEREGIPTRYLEPVLQQMVREGILVGIRGPAGGYRLARAPTEIRIGDIVRIAAGLETGEGSMVNSSDRALGSQVVHLMWTDLENEMMRRLDGISIEELRSRARRPRTKAPTAEKRARRLS